MFWTFHTRNSCLNRDRHTLQYAWQTISRDVVQLPRISSCIYILQYMLMKKNKNRTIWWNFTADTPTLTDLWVSLVNTKIDPCYPQPLCTILHYYGMHYNGTPWCIACVGMYTEHSFVQWPVACSVPSHFLKPCWLLWPLVMKFMELSGNVVTRIENRTECRLLEILKLAPMDKS